MNPEIFISHSSTDRKVSRTICTALENRGLACWISSRDVKPGQNFQEQIVKAIRGAKIMVLVFTASANNSNEIKKELALASQNNLIVIPVRIEDVSPNEAFAYEFATRQWIDLFDNWETSIARLVDLIAVALKDQPPGDRANAGVGLTGDAAEFGKIVKPADQRKAASNGQEHHKQPAKTATRVLPAVIAATCVAVLASAGIAYLAFIRPMHREIVQANLAPSAPSLKPTAPSASSSQQAAPSAALPAAPQPTPKQADTMGNWAGTWAGVWFVRSGMESTVTIAIEGNSIVGTTLWRELDDGGTVRHRADGKLFNCKVNGNTANCELRWDYTDPAKDMKNHATGNLTLEADHLTGEFHQDEAEPTWRRAPTQSSMHVGAVEQWDLVRKN